MRDIGVRIDGDSEGQGNWFGRAFVSPTGTVGWVVGTSSAMRHAHWRLGSVACNVLRHAKVVEDQKASWVDEMEETLKRVTGWNRGKIGKGV